MFSPTILPQFNSCIHNLYHNNKYCLYTGIMKFLTKGTGSVVQIEGTYMYVSIWLVLGEKWNYP